MILNVEGVKTLVHSIEKLSQWMDREESKTANQSQFMEWIGSCVKLVSLAYLHSHNNNVIPFHR